MNDNYLWDKTGQPDSDVEGLERLLRPFAHDRPLAHVAEIRRRSWRWPAAIAAALAAAFVGVAWFVHLQNRPAWDVASLAGSPKIGRSSIGANGRLGEGAWLETDSGSKARLALGDVGEVEVEPDSRLELLRSRAGEHRMALDHGAIHASIWAPPGNFFVNTPSAVAVDLGCEYTLQVDPSGSGVVSVLRGWVAFERNRRESFIPAGAQCRTRRGAGPGTPYYADSSPAFRADVDRIDASGFATEPLAAALREARPRDAFTLWHLLSRATPDARVRVYDRLAQFVPPPSAVTREGVLNGDRRMLDEWWNALGLGDASWWRMWEQKSR